MIARLRRRHRAATAALALVGAPALAIALASRPALPPPAALPPALAPEPAAGAVRWTRDDLWPSLAIRTRLLAGAAGEGVELEPLRDPRRPEVLLFWARAGGPERLPEGARLLGRLAGTARRRFALPPDAGGAGRLYLYSLGHHELLGSAALAPPPDAAAAARDQER